MLHIIRAALGGQDQFDPQRYFSVPLYDLKESEEAFAGILAPAPERNSEKVGISAQFLDNAANYHERYSSSDHFLILFNEAIAATGYQPRPRLEILDIGTGSGVNSVVPCARLFKDCRIIATDLSPQLLAILSRYLASTKLEASVACVCTDAMNDFFKASKFDLVTGAAILHHLMDPTAALRSAYRALRPGGTAIFFEPFEAGCMVLATAFRDILAMNENRGDLSPQVEKIFRDMILDWTTRAGTDKSAPHFPHMDDKWLFTRTYLEQAAKNIGFSDLKLVPHAHGQHQFRGQTTTVLRLHSGLLPEALPPWAWEMIDAIDKSCSDELKAELSMEATIVLRK